MDSVVTSPLGFLVEFNCELQEILIRALGTTEEPRRPCGLHRISQISLPAELRGKFSRHLRIGQGLLFVHYDAHIERKDRIFVRCIWHSVYRSCVHFLCCRCCPKRARDRFLFLCRLWAIAPYTMFSPPSQFSIWWVDIFFPSHKYNILTARLSLMIIVFIKGCFSNALQIQIKKKHR